MNSYIKVKINRLFHGFASVRDYIVTKAIKEYKGLKLECNGQVMTIPYKQLHKGLENEDVFISKHLDGLKYKLIDYDFKPDKLPEQTTMLAGIRLVGPPHL